MIPWLGTRLEVTFQEVIINQDKQLVGGAVELRSDSSVKELLAEIDKNNPKEKTQTPPPPPPVESDSVVVAGTIAELSVEKDQQQVRVQLAGQSEPTLVSYAEGPVTIQDQAGNRYRVDEQGEVTNEGAVAGGDSEPGGSTSPSSNFTLEERIVMTVLEDFQTRIDAWLSVHGKGPLSDDEMQIVEGLPGCLPEEPETVAQAQEYVSKLLANPQTEIPLFTNRVKESPDWNVIESVSQGLKLDQGEALKLSESDRQNASEVVCPYIKEETLNYAQCPRCPKPDHLGQEGESVVTFDPDPPSIQRRGAKRWYYFAGYSQSSLYAAPDNSGEIEAGWYGWEDYLERIEPIIEAIAIVSGDVVLHPSNEEGIVDNQEQRLKAFQAGREISDNFKELVAKEYGRVAGEAYNQYSGSGHLESVYPIYEVLGLFTGKQLIRGVVKFGSTFRALSKVKSVVNYRFSDNVLKIFSKQGDEVAEVIEGSIRPIKFLDEGEEIAQVSGQKLLKQGDEVGFEVVENIADEVVDLTKVKLRKVMEGADDWRMVFYDDTNIGNVIVSDGGTRLELDIIIPKELRKKGISKEIFRQSIEAFDPIDIKATWKADPVKYVDSGGMSDNLAVFLKNRATMNDELAALNTPTGKIASEFAFSNVSKIEELFIDGKQVVQVIFSK